MADWLPLGAAVVDLDKVEAILLDMPRKDGSSGRDHQIFFTVGASPYEDRCLSLHEDSEEGIALRRWAEGLDDDMPTVERKAVA